MSDFATATQPAFDDREREYRTVEPWAILGLVLGLLSPVALLGSLLWLLPALGLAASLMALDRLRRDANRTGRAAALVGLAMSIVFGLAPAAQHGTAWILLSRQAREVSDQFFEYLREGSPEKALMLRFAPDQRQPPDELLWTFYRHDTEAKTELQLFVADPVVRTLLALGRRAEVRFYKTTAVATEGTRGVVNYYYTVTYPADAQGDGAQADDAQKTFFVSLAMERKPTQKPQINPWRVVGVQGGFDPDNPGTKTK